MVEIGGRPILWHIMKLYGAQGIQDFVVCLGHRGHMIKDYFANLSLHTSDVSFDLRDGGRMEVHRRETEPWRVTLVDTGEGTETGGRLKRVLSYAGDDDELCFTYGDGVSDLDIAATIDFHRGHGALATVTAVQPPGRWGRLSVDGDRVTALHEKPDGDGGWINGGFFVLSPRVGELIDGDRTVWEQEPLERLAAQGELRSYFHRGFWRAMDNPRDLQQLEEMWAGGSAPWRTWA
jgi:glucose-1-phosphate cytidylyltransferase